MKKPSAFFVFIVILGLGLMFLIAITQMVTLKALARLEDGNERARITFVINRKLEETVNKSFDLENRFLTTPTDKLSDSSASVKDSLESMQSDLEFYNIWSDSAELSELTKLKSFITAQSQLSLKILSSAENNNNLAAKLTDSLRSSHFGDSIYLKALTFQRSLETSLSQVIQQNSKATKQLASFNRLLAIAGLAAIIVLVTIIIRRQRRQLTLIKDLDIARQEAQHSAMVKDHFLANMSHEIRTPLNAMQGFSRLMTQTPLNNDQKRYMQMISTASENLLNLVNDILDFAKIEAGALVIRKKAFNLFDQVDELETMFKPMANEKDISFTVSIDKSINRILYSDPVRVQQILTNLIANAIKFTEHGKVIVTCKKIADNDIETRVQFAVEDTGIGIPADKLNTVFERFEQIDSTAARYHGGTGLGLAIVKKLTELMNGSINVSSEVGKGSVFTVELDFEKTGQYRDTKVSEAGVVSFNYELFSTKTILIAEDNQMNQLLLQAVLKKTGVNIIIAGNGEEALAKLAENNADIILMDIQMPGMDGIAATRLIRKKYGDAIPVIAMTAHVLDTEKERCFQAGMNAYLTKPVNEEDLISTLQNYLSLKKNSFSVRDENESNINIEGLGYLCKVCNGDKNKMRIILEKMISQLSSETLAFEKSLTDRDIFAIKKYCHNFKSTISPLDTDLPVISSLLSSIDLMMKKTNENEVLKYGQMLISVLKSAISLTELLLKKISA